MVTVTFIAMLSVRDLPHLNAALNCASALLTASGYVMIRCGRRKAHKRLMLTAVATSVVFLTSYVTYHIMAEPTPFRGTGVVRWAYFTMLVSHVVLAIAIVPLVGTSVYLGLRDRIQRHRRIARPTFWLWMYVSVTGVLVYLTLYHWNP